MLEFRDLADILPAPLAAWLMWIQRRLTRVEADTDSLEEKLTSTQTAQNDIRIAQIERNAEFVTYEKLDKIIGLHTEPIKDDVAEIKKSVATLLQRSSREER